MSIRLSTITLAAASVFAITFAAFDAQASNQSGPYSVEIIMNGVAQPVYNHGSQSFIAGSYGSAYQIRVNNQSGRRIEAVIAVDGRDVVTGQPVQPRSHRGYIIAPHSSTSVDGFRSSTASVATFRFATIPESYAWRTGTSWGIGTIRVWIFEERPQIMRHGPMLPQGAPSARSRAHGGSSAAEAAPQAMGTEYGEQRWSPVSYTTFVRSSSRASTTLGVRYNSYEMLAAAGIISPTPYSPVYSPVYSPCAGPYCYPTGQFAPPPPPYGYIR
jgi:hypothetical protein